jgi:hypothetical protein
LLKYYEHSKRISALALYTIYKFTIYTWFSGIEPALMGVISSFRMQEHGETNGTE